MVKITHIDGEVLVETDATFFPNVNEVVYLPDLKRDHDRFLIVRVSHELSNDKFMTRCLVQDLGG